MVAMILLMAGAVVLAIPILVVSIAIAFLISTLLMSLGVPNAIAGQVNVVVGLGGGLAVEFLVLVWLYRRFEPRLRKVTPPPPPPDAGLPRARRDSAADPATLAERLSALDSTLAPSDDPDRPYQ